jgi:hypothetical protein
MEWGPISFYPMFFAKGEEFEIRIEHVSADSYKITFGNKSVDYTLPHTVLFTYPKHIRVSLCL